MNPPSATTAPASLKRSLSIAALIMMVSVLLSRLTGLVRMQIVAMVGGTSNSVDSYITAFFVPELLNHFLAGGFLSVTFIPIFQKYLVKSDPEGAWRSFSNLFTIGTIAFAVLIPLMILFTPQILGLMGPGIAGNAHNFELTVRLTRIILPAQVLFYWGAFFMAVQYAHHRFLLPALAPLLYNIGIIGGGLLLGRRFGVEGFAWGVLVGAFAGNILVQWPGALRVGMKLRFRIDLSDPDLKRFALLSLPLVLGLGMTFSNEVFFRFFGSFLGEGGTASLEFGLRTMLMIVAVFGQASGVAIFPFLSSFAAEKKFVEMTRLLDRVIIKIGLYAIPLSLLFMVIAPQIIQTLYEHGNFTAMSTARTAPVFALYMAGAFSFSAAMIVNRSFYAIQNTFLPMMVGSAVAVLSLPVYYYAARAFGAEGIAFAAVVGMIAQFALLYAAWYKKFGDAPSLLRVVQKLVLIILVSALGMIAAWISLGAALRGGLHFGKIINNLIVCAAASLPMVVIVAVLYEVLGLQRIRDVLKKRR